MPAWLCMMLVMAAYLIGGLSPGYWLAKRAAGVDLRATGSGATGATNAGRVLGKRFFYLVAFLDALKGVAVTLAASHVIPQTPMPWQFAAALAVVAGHIWPVWLGFRGGKGVAAFYGAWCPLLNFQGLIPAGICLALALVLKYVFRRSFKNAWLAVQALFPVIIWRLTRNHPGNVLMTTIAIAAIVLIWWAHRKNIAALFRGQRTENQHTAPSSSTAFVDSALNSEPLPVNTRSGLKE